MAENVGKVVQVIGATVDCEFDADKLPPLLNAIHIEDAERNLTRAPPLECSLPRHRCRQGIRTEAP